MALTTGIPLNAANLAACAERLPVPGYDRARVRTGVVHIGVGGFHRAHQAAYHDRLLGAGAGLEWGICGVGLLPADRAMKNALDAQDGLYTLVVKHGDGRHEARVIGSLTEYLFAPDDPEAVIEKLAGEPIRIVSLTITEGGYDVDPARAAAGHGAAGVPLSAFGLVVEALRRRRERGLAPFTVMSCDNLQGNGDVARRVFAAVARERDPELAAWVERDVRFPNAMVDRITPQTTDRDRRELRERFGIEDRWPVVCEAYEQWVIEDHFSAGRPPYETVGAQLVDDVTPYELMKVRLLNGSHQAMSYFGHLCGYRFVHEAAGDERFRAFLLGYMDEEVTPTLSRVPGVDLGAYKRTLLERFSNAHIADTLARSCAWTSDRIPKFVLPVVRARLAAGGDVRRAAAVVASWARYAEGIDEEGEPIEVVDALRERLMARARRQREDPLAFLGEREVFGDLAGDARFTAAYVAALASLHERGARATLDALA